MLNGIRKLNSFDYALGKKKFYSFVLLFFMASLVGWIYEVTLSLIQHGEFINRGFLYGCYIPIYGMGSVLMVLLLKKFKNNPMLLLIFTMIIAGVLEYGIGSLMVFLYGRRWWSYEGMFLNLNGHICFLSVVGFGLAGLLLIYIIEPLILKLCNKINEKTLAIISYIIIGILVIDLILTLIFRNPL